MSKATYTRKRNALVNKGVNFVFNSRVNLEHEVLLFLADGLNYYKADGNIDHVKAAMIISTSYRKQWAKHVSVAFKSIAGKHYEFKCVVDAETGKGTFSYLPIPKTKQPSAGNLPSFDTVHAKMLEGFASVGAGRAPQTDDMKAAAANKRVVNILTDEAKLVTALDSMPTDAYLAFMDRVDANRIKRNNPMKLIKPKAKAKRKAPVKRKTAPKAKRTVTRRAKGKQPTTASLKALQAKAPTKASKAA